LFASAFAVAVVLGLSPGTALADPKDPGSDEPTASAEPIKRPMELAAANCGNNGADKRYSRDEVLRRARSWLYNTQSDSGYDPVNYQGDHVPYSQNFCFTNGYGSYRQDCSGYVSMAWGLGGRGDAWYTGNLRPAYSGGRTVAIAQSQLAPGDALLRHLGSTSTDHVGLFVRWVPGGALVYEQTGPPRVAVWDLDKVALYTPIRYTKLANTLATGQYGYLNLVTQSGNLNWYHHTGWSAGTTSWDPSFTVGTGWHLFDKVIADQRTVFGIRLDGTMEWNQYSTDTGWRFPDRGQVIGTGWNQMKFVVSGGSGIIYGITYAGEMKWYRFHVTPSGGYWDANSMKVIGTGWKDFRTVTASAGTFYAIRHNGDLYWYRYLYPYDAAAVAWAGSPTGTPIGTGWNAESGCAFQTAMSAGDGRIYVADLNGYLRWWRHLDPVNGSATWASVAPCGNVVGDGWLYWP
jgi:hypothetical protein